MCADMCLVCGCGFKIHSDAAISDIKLCAGTAIYFPIVVLEITLSLLYLLANVVK